MSQELLYHVRLKLKQGDVASVEKELNRLEKDGGNKAGTKEQDEHNKATREATKLLKEKESTLKALRKELKEYKEELAEVQRSARESGGATEDNVRIQRALGDAISDTQAKIESASRGNVDYDTALKETGMNLREMRGSLRAMKIAIDEVKDPLGEGAEEVANLTQAHDTLNTSIGNVEKSMGVHTRNVGNYEDSIRSAANAVAIFQGPLGPLAGRINSTATAISRYRAASAAGTKATLTFAVAIRTALIASGIGALIVAFTSLLAFFKRTEKGQNALKVASAGLSAIFQTFADVASKVGEFLFEAFNNPKEAIIDLGKAILDNVINRFVAIPKLYAQGFKVMVKNAHAVAKAIEGIWSKSAKEESKILFKEAGNEIIKFGNLALQVATGVEDGISKMVEGSMGFSKTLVDNIRNSRALQDQMNNVLITERELNVQRAITNRNLQEARDLARDLTVPHEQRLEALRQVREAEEEMMALELANENERTRIMKAQLEQHDSNTEAKDEFAQQLIRVADMEKEHMQRSISLRRDETSAERQLNELTLRRLRRVLEESQRTNALEIKNVEKKLEKEGKMVELAEKRRLNFLEHRLEEQKLREDAYFQELSNQHEDQAEAMRFAELKARQELDAELIDLDNNLADTKEQRHRAMVEANMAFDRNEAQRALSSELHILSQKNDEIGMIEAERRAFQEQSEIEHSQRLIDIEKDLNSKGIVAEDAKLQAMLILQQEYAEKSQEFDQRMSNAVRANREQMMDAIASLTKNSLKAIFGDSKEVAVATAIIDTFQGVVNALKYGPPPTNFINAAAVGAAGIANVRKILSTNLGSKTIDSSAGQVASPKPSFGLVDIPSLGTEVASQQAPAQDFTPTIVLEGEFDPEFLSIKVRQGTDSISGRVVTI